MSKSDKSIQDSSIKFSKIKKIKKISDKDVDPRKEQDKGSETELKNI